MNFTPIFALLFSFLVATNTLFSNFIPDKKIIDQMVSQNTRDQVTGAIMGAALGDALGRVTEFIPTIEELRRRYPSGLHSFKNFHANDWIKTDKGQVAAYTDDTVMAKLLLETSMSAAFVETLRETHPSQAAPSDEDLFNAFMLHLAKSYAFLFSNKHADPLYHIRAHGPTNIIAGERLAKLFAPLSYTPTEHKPATQFDPLISKEGGCGSVMRAWPLGITHAYNEPFLKLFASEQSYLTHRHPMALAACTAMAVGIAEIIKNQKAHPLDVVEKMIKAAEFFDNQEKIYKPHAQKWSTDTLKKEGRQLLKQDKLFTSDMLRYVACSYQDNPSVVLGTRNQKGSNYRSIDGAILGWAADEALVGGVYVFLRHPDDLQEALAEAVFTPGDSDSIGTLAGALVGARTGWKVYENTDLDDPRLENKDELQELALEAAQVLEIRKELTLNKMLDDAH